MKSTRHSISKMSQLYWQFMFAEQNIRICGNCKYEYKNSEYKIGQMMSYNGKIAFWIIRKFRAHCDIIWYVFLFILYNVGYCTMTISKCKQVGQVLYTYCPRIQCEIYTGSFEELFEHNIGLVILKCRWPRNRLNESKETKKKTYKFTHQEFYCPE